MSVHYILALICIFAFSSIQYIDATDDNSAKTQSPIKRHMMKRSYLWDVRLGKRSINPEAFPWYNHDLYNHYKDDNFRGYYTGYDD
ncbi:hypothetical protein MN116_001258 [Schistosoma mekongi]|uniref:Uncharacterized protein n=1 Tax=Schistosoma mekongi TaxID=38744 RepID=A0AAE1ZL79_SCHME|nr:hypothetical protein MN116_001258 [Schistosoma mekongi]